MIAPRGGVYGRASQSSRPLGTLVKHLRTDPADESAFAEIRIREVPRPVRGDVHALKYSLALVANGACFLRYDNEAGHRHAAEGRELHYPLRSAEALIEGFRNEVDAWEAGRAAETT